MFSRIQTLNRPSDLFHLHCLGSSSRILQPEPLEIRGLAVARQPECVSKFALCHTASSGLTQQLCWNSGDVSLGVGS